MSLPQTDPSLPANPAPIFQDNSFVRGDHARANNQAIWQNLEYVLNGNITELMKALYYNVIDKAVIWADSDGSLWSASNAYIEGGIIKLKATGTSTAIKKDVAGVAYFYKYIGTAADPIYEEGVTNNWTSANINLNAITAAGAISSASLSVAGALSGATLSLSGANGFFGVGGDGLAVTGNNANNIVDSGLYAGNASTVSNLPYSTSTGFTLEHITYDSNNMTQLYTKIGSVSTQEKWYRTKSAGTWSAWSMIITDYEASNPTLTVSYGTHVNVTSVSISIVSVIKLNNKYFFTFNVSGNVTSSGAATYVRFTISGLTALLGAGACNGVIGGTADQSFRCNVNTGTNDIEIYSPSVNANGGLTASGTIGISV